MWGSVKEIQFSEYTVGYISGTSLWTWD